MAGWPKRGNESRHGQTKGVFPHGTVSKTHTLAVIHTHTHTLMDLPSGTVRIITSSDLRPSIVVLFEFGVLRGQNLDTSTRRPVIVK